MADTDPATTAPDPTLWTRPARGQPLRPRAFKLLRQAKLLSELLTLERIGDVEEFRA